MGVKQKVVVLVSISLLFSMINIAGIFGMLGGAASAKNFESDIITTINSETSASEVEENQFFKYAPDFTSTAGDFVDWVIHLEYNGETFEKTVPVDITDFSEKFLKYPEYGEILYFDVDGDQKNEIEVIVGFYWSLIQDTSGETIKSLETRFRVRQLEEGGYLDDPDGEFEVRSEIHVNYGLVKKTSSSDDSNENGLWAKLATNIINKLIGIIAKLNPNSGLITLLQDMLDDIIDDSHEESDPDNPIAPVPADTDYISVGAGYRSPAGVEIPRYSEKRFAFARESIFSPTIFQHIMDPGSSKGKGPIEMIYGFQSYHEGGTTPSFDIDFSVGFDPAVYLKTKFVPLGGYVYYFFDTNSQKNDEVAISFSSNILQGSGEDTDLTLVFDKIDNNLGRTGSWMSFDVDMLWDGEPLGGGFHYKASDRFDVDILINTPDYKQKIEVDGFPKQVDVGWDIDAAVSLVSNVLNANIDGFVNLDMSSDIDRITVYYPKSYAGDEDIVLLDVPDGIPRDIEVTASAEAHVDLDNLQASGNYIKGKLGHQCSDNIKKIQLYLPDVEYAIVEVTDIPSYASAEGQLYWNKLSGYAKAVRSSTGNPDPVHIHLEFEHEDYGEFILDDILEIRDGSIYTSFMLDNHGYFNIDTSQKMFGNTLHVSNAVTGDELNLVVNDVSADNFRANWDIDTSGDQIQFNDIGLHGLIDTLKDFHIDLNYKGKAGALDLDWTLGESGSFDISLEQDDDLTLDFSQFAQDSTVFDLDGYITLSQDLNFDMSWNFKRGESASDPGYFKINQNTDEENIKEFDLYFTYNNKYGVDVEFRNLKFYLNLEWWLTNQFPWLYIWLDYEFSMDDFDGKLLWTDLEGITDWHDIEL